MEELVRRRRAQEEGWEDVAWPDYGILGFTAVHQLVVLGVVVHLVRNRDWPPYVTKNVALVAATGMGSSSSLVGGLIEYGFFHRRPGDVLAVCSAEAVLTSLGTALLFFPAFVRVYRNYTLLILHSAAMWSAMVQLQSVALPYILPSLVYLAKPSWSEFEEYRNRCFDNTWMVVASFMYMAAGIAIAIVLVVRMRRVRKQLNEFRVMMSSLAFLLVWALYLNPAGQWFWLNSPGIARRLVMMDNFVSTVVLFWCPIAVPFLKYLQQDEEYVSQFTFGFSRLPTPGQMRASLADQLGVEDLRRKFRKYAAGRVAPELPDFYKACMDREHVEGYFERKAMTMAIVDRFVAEGAEQEINISQECKQSVLDSDITRYNIFDDAIAEVLEVMEVNFKADFERTMEFRNLNKAVQREAREMQVLRQARLVPEARESREKAPRPFSRGSFPGSDQATQIGTPANARDGIAGEPGARERRRFSFSAVSSKKSSPRRPKPLSFSSPFSSSHGTGGASRKKAEGIAAAAASASGAAEAPPGSPSQPTPSRFAVCRYWMSWNRDTAITTTNNSSNDNGGSGGHGLRGGSKVFADPTPSPRSKSPRRHSAGPRLLGSAASFAQRVAYAGAASGPLRGAPTGSDRGRLAAGAGATAREEVDEEESSDSSPCLDPKSPVLPCADELNVAPTSGGGSERTQRTEGASLIMAKKSPVVVAGAAASVAAPMAEGVTVKTPRASRVSSMEAAAAAAVAATAGDILPRPRASGRRSHRVVASVSAPFSASPAPRVSRSPAPRRARSPAERRAGAKAGLARSGSPESPSRRRRLRASVKGGVGTASSAVVGAGGAPHPRVSARWLDGKGSRVLSAVSSSTACTEVASAASVSTAPQHGRESPSPRSSRPLSRRTRWSLSGGRWASTSSGEGASPPPILHRHSSAPPHASAASCAAAAVGALRSCSRSRSRSPSIRPRSTPAREASGVTGASSRSRAVAPRCEAAGEEPGNALLPRRGGRDRSGDGLRRPPVLPARSLPPDDHWHGPGIGPGLEAGLDGDVRTAKLVASPLTLSAIVAARASTDGPLSRTLSDSGMEEFVGSDGGPSATDDSPTTPSVKSFLASFGGSVSLRTTLSGSSGMSWPRQPSSTPVRNLGEEGLSSGRGDRGEGGEGATDAKVISSSSLGSMHGSVFFGRRRSFPNEGLRRTPGFGSGSASPALDSSVASFLGGFGAPHRMGSSTPVGVAAGRFGAPGSGDAKGGSAGAVVAAAATATACSPPLIGVLESRDRLIGHLRARSSLRKQRAMSAEDHSARAGPREWERHARACP